MRYEHLGLSPGNAGFAGGPSFWHPTSNDLWVIAARYGAGTADVTISGLPPAIANGEVYTEGRSVSVKDGSFTDSFDRWAVHVYRFSPTAG